MSNARRCLAGALLWVAACDAGSPPSQEAATPAPPEPVQSTFLEGISARDYPEVDAADVAPLTLRFDFSGKRVYAFDYHQEVETRTDMGSPLPQSKGSLEQRLTADGLLLMKSKGAGAGSLVLKDVKSRFSVGREKDAEREISMPSMVVPEVKEDGSMEGGAASAQPLLKILFPLPPKPLAKGDTAEVPFSLPFNLMGSPLMVKGTSRMTLVKFVRIEERTCARLDVEIDVSRLEVPEEVGSKASCSMKGRSVYYWDVEAKDFAVGRTAVLMKMRADMPAPKLPADAPALPDTLKMSFISDNLIRLKRNPAAAAREMEGK